MMTHEAWLRREARLIKGVFYGQRAMTTHEAALRREARPIKGVFC